MKTLAQLKTYCAQHHVRVDTSDGEIELITKHGYQFEADLHSLVSSPWDDDSPADVLRLAIQDALTYCPTVTVCPDDCTCKEEIE